MSYLGLKVLDILFNVRKSKLSKSSSSSSTCIFVTNMKTYVDIALVVNGRTCNNLLLLLLVVIAYSCHLSNLQPRRYVHEQSTMHPSMMCSSTGASVLPWPESLGHFVQCIVRKSE